MKKTAVVCLLLIALVLALGDPAFAQGGTWTTQAPMPGTRFGHSVAEVNGILFAIGGAPVTPTCSFLGTNEAYNPATDSWSSKAPMPTPRISLAVAVVNGILYAIGGNPACCGSSPLTTVEAYDPATDIWTTRASLPTPRVTHAAAVVNGIIYVFGGYDHTGIPVTTTHAYDPLTDTWSAKAAIPTPRTALSGASINCSVYAIGGYSRFTGHSAPTVEAYDPATDTWTAVASMPSARAELSAAVSNGVLFALGGFNSSTNTVLAANEAFMPAPVNRPPVAEAGPDKTVIVGESVPFDGTASFDTDGMILRFEWTFGDGGSASGAVVNHVFLASGSFQAILRVTDDDGATSDDTVQVTVHTASQAIGLLSDMVGSFNLQQGISNSLDAKLQNARDALNAANSGQRQDAANKLNAFLSAVEAQRGKELTDAQADALVVLARRILAVI